MRISTIVLLYTLLPAVMQAQQRENTTIKWSEEFSSYTLNGSEITVPECTICEQIEENAYAPYYLGKFELGKGMVATDVSITPIDFIEKAARGKVLSPGIPSSVNEGFEWSVKEERGINYLLYKFPAALKFGSNSVKLISSFKLNMKQNRISTRAKSASFVNNSVLAQGEWYKIGVAEDGMYKITKSDLQTLGIDVDVLNPQSLNIYGNGYGQLPFENSVDRPDDLVLNKIVVEGEGDESFDDTDYILFYAKGPDKWTYNNATELFDHHKHNYVDTSYYFIGINTGDMPARVTSLASSGNPPNYESITFNDYTFHEVDRENMLRSGRDWYGEKFDVQTTYNYSGEIYTFPNLDPTAETVVRASVLSRTTVPGTCIFTLGVNGVENVVTASAVSGSGTSNFGVVRNLEVRLTNASPALNININYQKNAPSATGWLDWLNINTRRKLRMTGNQMAFRDAKSVGVGTTSRFTVANVSLQTQIWDVTDPTNARSVSFNRIGDQAVFTLSTEILREFIGFNSGFKTPTLFGSVQNQNLHALGGSERIDMIIVAPSLLMDNAEDLADLHRNYELDPLNVQVVRLEEIYNEFSSGMRDVTAIKWFMKMLYDRANGNEALMTRYLLLFGDGSYDNKNFTPGNTNLIPTFQSANSLSPTNSYVSDDYFTLLSDDDGEDSRDLMDMAVGRIVAKNKQEANSVVNKIRKYVEIKPQTFYDDCTVCGDNTTNFGAWRNSIVLVADDEDNNTHMSGAMSYSNIIESYSRDYNIERIFIDAFPEVATPGGARYPAANKAIERTVENGAFIMNYVGHGGELGLAAERILDIPMILNWGNGAKLPVFITATCEFTRYDDPLFTSAGELALLNGNGGAITLLTTTRLVYSGPNKVLNDAFYEAFFNRPEGEVVIRVGDPCREAKNATSLSSGSSNLRNFSLIGDPAIPMAVPRYIASVLSITDTLGNAVDTLKALGVVRVNGHVTTENGSTLGNFNGRLNATVFDRVEIKETLANKSGSVPFTYPSQENVVYKGNAEVKNGLFTFDFVIPKDISFAIDSTARISLYAMSDVNDATGYEDSLKIGSRDPNAVNDGTGPELNVYLNDENFVFGGYTNDTPILVATIFDENGINTVGSGIGHDITAVIDGDESNAMVLNDYYESDLNTFKSGKVQYQFDKLEPGKHNIKLKVWDVHNNSNETEIEFVVSDNEDFSITRVLNYPNPFTTHTEFYFEHNQSCEFLNVLVQIYTISGKLVKSINTVSNTDGFRNEPIAWDGRDDYGDRLATGVYVYKLAVRNPSGEQVEKFEKLVVLN
ncbi:type IX secretion system sortase PorU [Cryomorpha ignava]|uniref:Type IX secretion system sortase PorU n=1 Tax=Cryomorpha ignava TaxID=101383 RepID=A0A7K3WMQ4_9FLAO|nr:type IX secretion system sortase PorU [Cryomorpha ignava]NEN22808.1 type IX secretion system sortase PorU [Cryomorpha ignava]